MTKNEILKNLKIRDEDKKYEFLKFMKNENFIETINHSGFFPEKSPLFYKQVANHKFLLFNIPFYGRLKNVGFNSEFWTVNTNTEKNFLKNILNENDYDEILLGFELENDLAVYKSTKLKFSQTLDTNF